MGHAGGHGLDALGSNGAPSLSPSDSRLWNTQTHTEAARDSRMPTPPRLPTVGGAAMVSTAAHSEPSSVRPRCQQAFLLQREGMQRERSSAAS